MVDPDDPQDNPDDVPGETADSTATDLPPVAGSTMDLLPSTTAPSLSVESQATVAMLPPVADTVAGLEPVAPPRKNTKSEVPRKKTKGETPAVDLAGDTHPRVKPAKGVVPSGSGPDASTEPFNAGGEEIDTDPRQRRVVATEPAASEPRFEVTPARVAIGAGVFAVLAVVGWLVVPALTQSKTSEPEPAGPTPAEPIVLKEPPRKAAPPPVAPKDAPTEPQKPATPTLTLDTHVNVIDPYGTWAPDIALDASHKYALTLHKYDPRFGTVLARLNEKAGWGVMNLMAEHHSLRFGGASALRLHCEPGSRYADNAAIPLDLEDLARRKKTTVSVTVSKDCFDFSNARKLELGEQKYRVRLPADQTAKLGEKIALRVAWRVQTAADPVAWRGGILEAGHDVLVEGVFAQFAILDPYAADNEGEVKLELLPPDTRSSGLVP